MMTSDPSAIPRISCVPAIGAVPRAIRFAPEELSGAFEFIVRRKGVEDEQEMPRVDHASLSAGLLAQAFAAE